MMQSTQAGGKLIIKGNIYYSSVYGNAESLKIFIRHDRELRRTDVHNTRKELETYTREHLRCLSALWYVWFDTKSTPLDYLSVSYVFSCVQSELAFNKNAHLINWKFEKIDYTPLHELGAAFLHTLSTELITYELSN